MMNYFSTFTTILLWEYWSLKRLIPIDILIKLRNYERKKIKQCEVGQCMFCKLKSYKL